MRYSDFVDIYEKLSGTTKKLEKSRIIADFLPKLDGHDEFVYLLRGKVWADYDDREFGMSGKLAIKSIAKASGMSAGEVIKRFHKIGDLGDVAEEFCGKKKQSTLFSSSLDAGKVYGNLQRLAEAEGKGAVSRKVDLVVELLSGVSGREAKWVVRTVLGDLRVGVADAILRDSIVEAFFKEDDWKEMKEKVEEVYDKLNDFAEVLKVVKKGKRALDKVEVAPGRPLKVMLPVKVTDIDDAFRICGNKVAVEHKYDGFRVVISKVGDKVELFTRRLDNVTKQFPDVVKAIKTHVKAKSVILDSEVVGYEDNNGKKKYRPFEAISQRIKRKYDIDKLIKKLPVEINVFDVLYYDGKSVIDLPFLKRRRLIEKIVRSEEWKIRLATQIVTDDKKSVMEFYKDALRSGEEGIMVKKIDAPYRPGRRVGYIVKMKPEAKDLDLVIVGAEYGTGKRAGGLTSFIVACKDETSGKFLEVGKVSSGLKEKEESEGTTYKEIDKLLQPLILKEEKGYVSVKPKVVVSVTYQNIQASPKYASGFALRFPRITHYRPERGRHDITTLDEIKKDSKKVRGGWKGGLG